MPSIVQPVPVMLDKERHLRFDYAVIYGVEPHLSRVWGRDYNFYGAMRNLVSAAAAGDPGALSLSNLSILLWQGCLHEDPQLTLEQVQQALPCTDWTALMPLVGQVMAAWQAVSPPPVALTDMEETDSDPLDASTGVNSGRMAVSISG